MEKLKMYIVCENRGPQWFYCYGFLSNGFCFGQHLCSHPSYAFGDLYAGREKRKITLKKLFGVDYSDLPEIETTIVNSKDDVPKWWNEFSEKQESLKPFYDQYNLIVDDSNPKIEVEFSE